MALSNAGTGLNVTSGATVSISSVSIPAGSLIVVAVFEATATVAGSVTDTAGNTYTLVTSVSNSGLTQLFYCKNCLAVSSSATALTYTKNAAAHNAYCSAGFNPLGDPTAPLDTAVTATGSGTSSGTIAGATSGTPAKAGEQFVAALGVNGGITFTEDTTNGWATPFNNLTQIFGGNEINAGTGTISFAPGIGATSRAWGVIIAGFKTVPLFVAHKPLSVYLRR